MLQISGSGCGSETDLRQTLRISVTLRIICTQLYIRMKSALTVVLLRLFLIGVFADGKETSNVELVSLTEEDSVTLKSGVTRIQTDDEIEWLFRESPIATISSDSSEISVWVESDGSFKDRLQLDKQTGDLKISNIKTTDSGLYKPTVSSPRGSPPEITFTVKVVPADEEKSVTVEVTVLVGDSVTLNTDPTDILRDDVIRWRFGQQKSPVAEINRKAGIFNTYNGPDGSFRDRLKVDNQTGSLNITNITATHSGVYEADISSSSSSSSRYTIHHTQSFNVTISDEMKSVSVKEGETVTLQTVTEMQNLTEIQNDGLIHWMFGGAVIAEIRKAAPQFSTSDGTDGRFRLRLYLDRQTGSLNIINTNTTDSGLYELKISRSRSTINRRITVTVTGLDLRSDSGLSPAAVAGIVVGVIVLLVAVGGVIYCCKKYKRTPPMSPEEDQDPPLLENGETKLTKPVEMENRSS